MITLERAMELLNKESAIEIRGAGTRYSATIYGVISPIWSNAFYLEQIKVVLDGQLLPRYVPLDWITEPTRDEEE